MAANRLLLGLFVVNLVVTAALVVWVVSVATGNDSWLPAALSLREDLEQLQLDVDELDDKAQAAGELAYEGCEGAQNVAYDLNNDYNFDVFGPGCGTFSDPYGFSAYLTP